MKKILLLITVILIAGLFFVWLTSSRGNLKLYWFIPDGVRAEPELFNMYQWAREGKLPNIKKMMDRGSYGYSYPNFPSHTPTNFATLLTGSYPEVHGVNDGPMHVLDKPLDKIAIGGFRSVAKKVPPIWKTLEDVGYKVALLSIPGSTPPDINKGVVLRGRWGGWGADFHAINFEKKGNLVQRILQGRGVKLFYFGPSLTQYIDGQEPSNWSSLPQSYSKPYEVVMNGWDTPVYSLFYDSTNDQVENYDRVQFSLDKKTIFADLRQGEWSDWNPITLKWKVEDQTIPIETEVKAAVIKLDKEQFFRIRLFYNNLNSTVTQPQEAAQIMNQSIGPMVDFADNYPAQLVYYPEDKQIFQDESALSFEWHKKAVKTLIKQFSPDVVIHDIYTPNQMLTSRWWMGYVDPNGEGYKTITSEQRDSLWQEVQDTYKKLDDIVGEILKVSDGNTYIVFSSDHGNVPLNKNVNLNNLFAQKGWLHFSIDPKTGEPIIDWKNSTVMYLKMAHVYINPKGLSGNYKRATGTDYEQLREEVKETLLSLQDENGVKPTVEVVEWERAKEYMRLDPDRIGDLVIANAPGYGWGEEMTNDLSVFSQPNITGYKQAIKAKEVKGMWTPFIMMGPHIKKNNYLGETPFEQIDQYPTLMKALGVKIPAFVQGKSLSVFQ